MSAGAAAPGMPRLAWLTARPIAHRGLHDASAGIIENTASAVEAAIAGGYGIEVDLQVTSDGEAVVHHDEVLGRLTEGSGRIDAYTAAELKRLAFRATTDRMLALGDLCDLVAGRAPLVLELKSHFDTDRHLVTRTRDVLANYPGPAAAMSFDPRLLEILRALAPGLTHGLVAQRRRIESEHEEGHAGGFQYWRSVAAARPEFLAYAVRDLPRAAPLLLRHVLRLPLLTWTVRTQRERQIARRWADQMIFEGFRP